MTKRFVAFLPVFCGDVSTHDNARVFYQADIGKYFCRLSMRSIPDFGIDHMYSLGDVSEIADRYRKDARWQEITDEAVLAELLRRTQWAEINRLIPGPATRLKEQQYANSAR